MPVCDCTGNCTERCAICKKRKSCNGKCKTCTLDVYINHSFDIPNIPIFRGDCEYSIKIDDTKNIKEGGD